MSRWRNGRKRENANRRAGGPARAQRQAAARALAVMAPAFIAADPERLGRFRAMTGIGPDSVRAAAREPQFLAGVLDYLVADEELLRAFAAQSEIDPE